MDITRFNKELANKIAMAKRYEKSGDIKFAIKLWIEISEMTIELSKNQKLDASFRNMLMNRTKGIFEHINILKSGEIKYGLYSEKIQSPQEMEYIDDNNQPENLELQDQESVEISAENSNTSSNQKIIKESNLKNLPKGFKEIESTKDFEIITPHDKDFVKKQLDKALDSDYFKRLKQEDSEESSKNQKRLDFEHPEDNKVCFACGYDKNLIKDKICRNCGTQLD